MPKPSGSNSGNRLLFSSVVAIAVGYAALRYNVFAGVPWRDFPLFVSNKGLSLASVILIGAAYLVNRRRDTEPRGSESRRALARAAGLSGFALAVIHVLVSFVVLGASAYPRLFDGGGLSAAGWTCLLFGTLATPLFAIPAIYSFPRLVPRLGPHHWKRAQQLGYAGLALTAVHVLSIGAHNWAAVSTWPGGMPPISLLSFVACAVPLGVKAMSMAAVYRARLNVALGAAPEMGVRE
jgi:DMSO/TMAO reductase YedYZ heme-binding membrane subunit